jgi:hypothetical protein
VVAACCCLLLLLLLLLLLPSLSYTGEDGFELSIPNSHMVQLAEAMVADPEVRTTPQLIAPAIYFHCTSSAAAALLALSLIMAHSNIL